MMMVGTPDPSSSCAPLAAWLHSLVVWKALLLFLFEESRNVLKRWEAGFSTKGKDVSAHISLFVLQKTHSITRPKPCILRSIP